MGSAHPLGYGGSVTLIERWHGTAWSIVPSPSAGTLLNSLPGVSCISSTDCNAVGTAIDYESFINEGIIVHWNGSSWTLQVSPPLGGANQRGLYGVAVVGGRYMAVGATGEGYLQYGSDTYVVRSR